ncbi:hypothetical protein ACEPAH_4217 [Sanghuangporus vaninii]
MLPHELPLDVFFMILMLFGEYDIYNYLKASPARPPYLDAISSLSGDKKDWEYLHNTVIKNRSFPVPSNLRCTDDVEVHDIASWVIHSVVLYKEYRTQKTKLYVRKIDIKSDLRVTWLKVFLGSWCLIAAANDNESELSLWEIPSNRQIRLASRKYLDAPVLDGEVDYCDNDVRCAITVGATKLYILVLELSNTSRHVSLQQVAHIPGTSYVTYFRRDLIGFASRDEDDTYPYLANWRTGETYCLRFPHTNPSLNCPLPIEPCKAITVKDGFVFALHVNTVEIFGVPDGILGTSIGDSMKLLRHISTLPLSRSAACGSFLGFTQCHTEWPMSMIRLIYQDGESKLRRATILYNCNSRSTRLFSIHERITRQAPDDRILHFWRLGSTGRTIVGLISSFDFWQKPTAIFSPVNVTNQDGAATEPDADDVTVSDEAFSLPELTSCMDFDDGHGLLLTGSTTGNVLLASVLEKSIITTDGISRLSSSVPCSTRREKLHDTPISLDLPLFYNVRKEYTTRDELPEEILLRAGSEWSDSRIDFMSIEDWSNDWSRFKRIWRWILPLSRWGPLDRDFLSVTLRSRLHTVGEIIPVLYRVTNHDEVVFRIGQRLYYSNQEPKDEEGQVIDVSAIDEYGLLGVLPLSYDNFVNNPQSIIPSLQNHHIQTNLRTWGVATGKIHQTTIAYWSYESSARSKIETKVEEPNAHSGEGWPGYVDGGDTWRWED